MHYGHCRFSQGGIVLDVKLSDCCWMEILWSRVKIIIDFYFYRVS